MVHVGRPLLIAVLVLTEVGLWQWRMVLAARNNRLGAVLLGGNRWSTLSDAGEVDEHTAGALARADAMFATAPAPATLTWF